MKWSGMRKKQPGNPRIEKRRKRSSRCCRSHTREGGSSLCRWKDRTQKVVKRRQESSEKFRIWKVIVCGRRASRYRRDGTGEQAVVLHTVERRGLCHWSRFRRLHNLWNRCKVHNRCHRDHNLQHCRSVFKVGKIFTWPARCVGEQKDGSIARTAHVTGECVKTACNR